MCLAKSPNKQNRIFATAEPLGPELTAAIEEEKISQNQDVRDRSRLLQDLYNWNANDAKKIWCFGPESSSLNVLVD